MTMIGRCCHCDDVDTSTCNLFGYNRSTGVIVWSHGGFKAVPTYNDTVACIYPKTTEEWDLQSVWVYGAVHGSTINPPSRVMPLIFPEYLPYLVTRAEVTTWEWVYRFIDIGTGDVTDIGTSHLEVSRKDDRLDRGETNTFPSGLQVPVDYQVLGEYGLSLGTPHRSIQSVGTNWYFLNAYDLSTASLEYWIDAWPSRYDYTITIPAFGADPAVELTWDQATTAATIQSDLNALPQIVSATATCTGADLSSGRTTINITWVDPSLTITGVQTEYKTGEAPVFPTLRERGTAYLLKAQDSTIVTSRALGHEKLDPNGGRWRGVLMEGGDLLEFSFPNRTTAFVLTRWAATNYASQTWTYTAAGWYGLNTFTLGSNLVMWGQDSSGTDNQAMFAWDYNGTLLATQLDATTQVFRKILHQVDDSDIAKNFTSGDGVLDYGYGNTKPVFYNRFPLTNGADLSTIDEGMNLGSVFVEMVGSSTAALFAIRTRREYDIPGELLLIDGSPMTKGTSGFETGAPFPVPGYYLVSWTIWNPPNYRVVQDAATEYKIGLGYRNLPVTIETDWISATANQATVQAAMDAAFGTHTGTPPGSVMIFHPLDPAHATSDPDVVHDYMLWQDFVTLSTYRMVEPDASGFGLLSPTLIDNGWIKISTRNTQVVINDLVSRVSWTDGEPEWESGYGTKLDGSQGYPAWGFMTDLSNVLLISGDHVNCCNFGTVYLDPNGNGAVQDWDVNDYTNVDDGIREPNAPTGGSGNRAELEIPADGEIVQWTCEDVPAQAGTATTYRLWVYYPDSTSGLFGVNVRIDSVWQTQITTVPDGSSGNWDYWDFTTSTDASGGITGNGIEIEAEGITDNFYVDACYLQVFITEC